MMIYYLRKFGRDFRVELRKEFGNQLFSKEIEEVKTNVESIRKKIEFLSVVILCSWVYFLLVLGACNGN